MNSSPQPLFNAALRGIFAAIGGDFVQKVFGLLATSIVLFRLTPYDYGLWQLVLSVLTAFDVFLLASIGSMLIADVSREIGTGNRDRAGTIVARSFPFFALLGVVAAVLMLIAAPFITRTSGIDLTFFLQIVGVSLIGEGVSQGYQLILQGTLDLVHAQATKVLRRAAYLAAIFVLVFYSGFGLSGVVVAYTFSVFLPIVVYAPVVWRRYRLITRTMHPDAAPFLEAAWERGRWSLGGDLVSAATGAFSPWAVGYYLSVTAVGYVSVAMLILGQVASLAPISFILRSVLPRTLGAEGRTRAWLVRSMRYAVWSQIFGGFAALLGAYFLIPIVFPAYIAVVPLLAALLLSLPVRAVGVVASEWFYAAKRQRALFFASNLPKVVLLALLPVFLSPLGLGGYALQYLLSSDILTYLRLRLIAKEEGGHIGLREILVPDREDGAILRRILDAIWKMRYTRS